MKNATEYDVLKQRLKHRKQQLAARFSPEKDIVRLTHQLVHTVDKILTQLFHQHQLNHAPAFCLVALGSYGRRELQLYSDVDLLLLYPEHLPETALLPAQHFIQSGWDIGLEISHQLTTVSACATLAQTDLSVISSLLDIRFLCGDPGLMETLQQSIQPSRMWPIAMYFMEKQQEQALRHQKYGETAYILEPNLKQGIGGLRDLQAAVCVGKRHFGPDALLMLLQSNVVTPEEYQEFLHCQHFLWRVRFALHALAKKKEDRLLFNFQIQLAQWFGYQDNAHSLAVEQFMKIYFQHITRSRELNEFFLQWVEETIVNQVHQAPVELDAHFQLINHAIEVRKATLFQEQPDTLMLLFLWVARDPRIQGVRANTIRLIRQNLSHMTEWSHGSKQVKSYFIAILNAPHSPYRALHLMARHGVLGHYLPAFAHITGQMQYDLFHTYTVDRHTLFLIRNLEHFLSSEANTPFPLAHQLMQQIPQRDVLYLAALFHDIAKGRGGDHCELGSADAREFALGHQLDQANTTLLVWLVEHHLRLSQTAQRQDIYDPEVIRQFCAVFPHPHYLDYLYLLTVADICATNPTLWNSWKNSLLKELYHAAKRHLHTEQTLPSESERIQHKKQHALRLLEHSVDSVEPIACLWNNLEDKYFLQHPVDSIVLHTQAILACNTLPLILIRPHYTQAGTEILVYMPHREERLMITTTVFSNHRLTIQEAYISTCVNQFSLDTYIVLDEHNQPLHDSQQLHDLQHALSQCLGAPPHARLPRLSTRRLSRLQTHFKLTPQITYDATPHPHYTSLFLVATDRPGLLASLAHVFLNEAIHLHSAKISTAGERAEDTFYITNAQNTPLSQAEQSQLTQKIVACLSAP